MQLSKIKPEDTALYSIALSKSPPFCSDKSPPLGYSRIVKISDFLRQKNPIAPKVALLAQWECEKP